MIPSFEQRYADLLVNYCLSIKKGDLLYVRTSSLALPLLKEVYRSAMRQGAHVEYDIEMEDGFQIWLEEADDAQISYVPTAYKNAMLHADAYLNIRAPYNMFESRGMTGDRMKQRSEAVKQFSQAYAKRTAEGSMRRTLCQYPTQAAAQNAGMNIDAYREFIYQACRLDAEDPKAAWLQVRAEQQKYVDRLNAAEEIHYLGEHIDLKFNTKGRTWINSDGQTNMPSGEVYTSPVEDSVVGRVHFTFPSIYMGEEVQGVTLEVRDGKIIKYHADRNKAFLDKIFKVKGTRHFGEMAVGTNYNIRRMTKNILFDEKIGGTVHMAIGQSYAQAGGKNNSSVHWDMITDMTKDGQILADGEKVYEKGRFLL